MSDALFRLPRLRRSDLEASMSLKEYVVHELDRLDDDKLKQVADYLAFLRYQSRPKMPEIDESALAVLYAEFGEADRELAEEGLDEYVHHLAAEDKP